LRQQQRGELYAPDQTMSTPSKHLSLQTPPSKHIKPLIQKENITKIFIKNFRPDLILLRHH
ncbi:hypothetical protein LIN78_09705, partial [Leeia sp. TBRC 13508]